MKLTINRIQYLLYLNSTDNKKNVVTNMAKLFQVSKSTVSRNLDYFVKEGILFFDSTELTEYGKRLADRYEEEVELLSMWIRRNVPCNETEIRHNAMEMVVHLSEEMKSKMFQKIRLQSMFRGLDYEGEIVFSEFVSLLRDGIYQVPFLIYREGFKDEKWLSMADRGFEHPATLIITGDTGILQLRAVTMEHRNVLDKLLFSGKLKKLEFMHCGIFKDAMKDGDTYMIPADAMNYTFRKEEGIMVGHLVLQMSAPIGNRDFHCKKAGLSIFLNEM